MGYYDRFPEYIPVAKRKAQAQKKRQSYGRAHPQAEPVVLTGSSLASQWWGKAWNNHLKSFTRFAERLARGRSYVRIGAILDLKIFPGEIRAVVAGSMSTPYQVQIHIKTMSPRTWKQITRSMQGKLSGIQELLQGQFPQSLEKFFTQKQGGLFPAARDMRFSCSCPDSSRMCKHAAAVLYGIGSRLDSQPQLLFLLRGVQQEDLIKQAIVTEQQQLLKGSHKITPRTLSNTPQTLENLFGLALEEPEWLHKRPSRKASKQKSAPAPREEQKTLQLIKRMFSSFSQFLK